MHAVCSVRVSCRRAGWLAWPDGDRAVQLVCLVQSIISGSAGRVGFDGGRGETAIYICDIHV